MAGELSATPLSLDDLLSMDYAETVTVWSRPKSGEQAGDPWVIERSYGAGYTALMLGELDGTESREYAAFRKGTYPNEPVVDEGLLDGEYPQSFTQAWDGRDEVLPPEWMETPYEDQGRR